MSTINVSNLAGPSSTGTAAILSSVNGGPISGSRNRIINGSMETDQRYAGGNQTFTAGAALAYSVDRWYGFCTGANVVGTRSLATGAVNRYRLTGAAGVTAIGFGQRIEAQNSFDLAGTTVTLSAFLANSLLTTVTWTAYYANTTDTFGTLAAPTRTQIATGSWTVANTNVRYDAQISIPAAATTGLEIVFTVGAQTSGNWHIWNVQLEPGTVATPFERRSYGQELALCQRYYNVFSGFNIEGYANLGSTRAMTVPVFFPVQMRATPTRAVITAGTFTNVRGSSTAYAGLGLNGLTTTYASASAEATGAGLCQYINATESMSAEL